MSVGKWKGTVTRKVFKRGMLAHFGLHLTGVGDVRAEAVRQLFEGGLKSGYVPREGDAVEVMGNLHGREFIQVYTIGLLDG